MRLVTSALPCLALQVLHYCPRMASLDNQAFVFTATLWIHLCICAAVLLTQSGNCTSRSGIVVSALLLLIHVQYLCVQGTGLASHRSNGNKTAVAESFALTSEECQDIRYAFICAVACCMSCQQMLLACAAHLIVWAAQPCCRPPVAILYIAPADAIQFLP